MIRHLLYCRLNEEHLQFIKDWIDEEPAITLQEISNRIMVMYDFRVSITTVHKEIAKFNYSLKRLYVVAKAAVTDDLW